MRGKSLPPPESVTASNLRLPAINRQDALKALAVISTPTHALFNRCAHALSSSLPAWSLISTGTDTHALDAITAAADALPHGLSPRQAAIAASFLATMLAWAVLDSGTRVLEQTLVDPSRLAATAVKLVLHGVVASRDAALTVVPQEIDGLDYSTTFCLDIITRREKWQELQPWACCPRCVTLVAVGSFIANQKGAGIDALQREVDRLPVEKLVHPELVHWLLRCVLLAPRANTVMFKVVRCLKWAEEVYAAVKERRQHPSLEPVLLELPSSFHARLRNCQTPDDEFITVRYYFAVVEAFSSALYASSKSDTSKPLPAPHAHFILSAASSLLDVLEGPTFLLPPTTSSGTSSSMVAQEAYRSQQQRQPSQHRIGPALQNKADRIRALVVHSASFAESNTSIVFQMLANVVGERLPSRHSVVESGLALRLFECCLKGEAGYNITVAMAAVLQTVQYRDQAISRTLSHQIIAKLASAPALMDTLLARSERHAWIQDSITGMCLTALQSSTDATCKVTRCLLLEVALPVIGSRRLSTYTKLCASLCLATPRVVPDIICQAGVKGVEAMLAALQANLHDASCAVVLSNVMQAVLLLEELQSERCQLPRPEVLVYQKELLWCIGQEVDECCERGAGKEVWDFVSAATNHKMGGQQLQLLYEVMGRQGYSSQSFEWVDTWLADADIEGHASTVFRTTGNVCRFLCRYLAHAATADTSTLPPDHAQLLEGFVPAAGHSVTMVFIGWPYDSNGYEHAPCALVSCLLTWSNLAGRPFAASEFMGNVMELAPLCLDESGLLGCLQFAEEPAPSMAAVAWLAAVLHGGTLQDARALLQATPVWEAVAELAVVSDGGEDKPAAVMARGLLTGVAAAVKQAGLVPEGGRGCAAGTSIPQQLAVCVLAASASLCEMPGEGRTCDAKVDWGVRLPEEWPEIDDVLQREWWGAVARWAEAGEGSLAPDNGVGDNSVASGSGCAGGAGAVEVRQCAACGVQADPLQLCGGCQAVRYCSADCQKAHWKQHRRACKAARAAAACVAGRGAARGTRPADGAG